ncbi:MAG TPA: hypothetical protein EYP56_03735, partial [Planctomycetaceae bacterium]|nr:hypothetical protein [Planctomycetaceae bacterium]HIQ21471.1 hypothetical protein [Planctomycetota bacterium]
MSNEERRQPQLADDGSVPRGESGDAETQPDEQADAGGCDSTQLAPTAESGPNVPAEASQASGGGPKEAPAPETEVDGGTGEDQPQRKPAGLRVRGRTILIGSQRDPAAYRPKPKRDWIPVDAGSRRPRKRTGEAPQTEQPEPGTQVTGEAARGPAAPAGPGAVDTKTDREEREPSSPGPSESQVMGAGPSESQVMGAGPSESQVMGAGP